jgi:hypothetical protein
MTRRILGGVLLLVLLVQAELQAITPPPRALPDRVAAAAIIVVGQVTAVEEAKDKPGHKVMTVKVAESLLGAKGLTHVRVLFTPRDLQSSPASSAPPPTLPLAVGQEGCFALGSLTADALYRAIGFDYAVAKKDQAYEKQLASIKRYAKLLEDPAAGLKAKERDDRFTTAGLLILRYRAVFGADKTEPIDAEQSKLILQALAEADWKPEGPRVPTQERTQMTPAALFQLVGPAAKDGWTPPANFQEFTTAAQKWLKEHAATYRIQRFVPPAAKDN